MLSFLCTRPDALIELTSLSDTYSGEIVVLMVPSIFRDNRNTEHVYVNMSSAKVLPGDYPSIVGKELVSDSRASCDSYCKVVFREVIRQYNERTGHILLEDENDEIYLLDPESMEWFAEGTANVSRFVPIRLARQLTLHTKVVVTIPGRITSIGERNLVVRRRLSAASFTTEVQKFKHLMSTVLLTRTSIPFRHLQALLSQRQKNLKLWLKGRVATWERECEATIKMLASPMMERC